MKTDCQENICPGRQPLKFALPYVDHIQTAIAIIAKYSGVRDIDIKEKVGPPGFEPGSLDPQSSRMDQSTLRPHDVKRSVEVPYTYIFLVMRKSANQIMDEIEATSG
jgi:hypothetical protein